MPIILNIGYHHFLVKNEAAAMKALAGLAGAVALEYTYEGHRKVYYPTESAGSEMDFGMTTIAANQLVRCKPGNEKAVVTTPGMELEVRRA